MTDTITGNLSSRVEKQDAVNYTADVEGSLLSDKIGVALTPQVAPQANSPAAGSEVRETTSPCDLSRLYHDRHG